MPEIGETLRETRVRRRIDMSEVEAATKIRAKYLRALENEEWDLLPGPTFVKTFLRTYAEYLDLDPRLLVEEYRQRFERPASQDLTPFGSARGSQGRRRRQRQRRPIGPIVVLLGGVLALLGVLYLLGTWGDDPSPSNRVGGTPTTTPTATATPERRPSSRRRRRQAPTRVTLKLTATKPVYVCVEDASGREVVDGDTLDTGQTTRTFRSQRFRANFGNGGVRMTIDGERHTAADLDVPVGYELRPGKRPRRLSENVRVGLCAT